MKTFLTLTYTQSPLPSSYSLKIDIQMKAIIFNVATNIFIAKVDFFTERMDTAGIQYQTVNDKPDLMGVLV
ncbi:hypothetical protein [Portibacter marinus]|uniref:hypothetical protein n=1 Tax=Portibacter marinus TaxID=2898660 RepID=UPI001F42F8F0|nr:hypothetical protein [Portibacter marinus]